MARGIDRIEKTLAFYGTSPTTTVSYPVYDAHGNMVRTLSKNSGGYTVTAARVFGAWGEVRNSSGPSTSKGRYVANLGHVQDDESGLIYMRARSYEPWTGRFVNEDPNRNGHNWLTYASNDPVNRIDENGKQDFYGYVTEFACWTLGAILTQGACALAMWGGPTQIARATSMAVLGVLVIGAGVCFSRYPATIQAIFGLILGGPLMKHIITIISGAAAGGKTTAALAVQQSASRSLLILGFLAADMLEPVYGN